jgi:dolichol-phosphate mannosyltransferase
VSFAIILPVYNEMPTLPAVLDALLRFENGHIVLVDDGSTDDTPSIARRYPLKTIIRHPHNMGYGRSLMDGFQYAIENGYKACITLDADAQHEPRNIPCFLDKLKSCDIVSGSRYLDPALMRQGTPPPDRLEINRMITQKINAVTGYHLTDSFCGFKAYRVDGLKKLRLNEDSYGFPIQVWLQAAKAGLTVTECAVPLIYRDHSRNFNNQFAGREERLAYYLRVLDRESKGLRN